jgi:predicted nucleic acid-binding protein|tara:strand:- start:521 stop:1735 length:1215 start_codon:yes stop_codon:yes gene_type:complete
MGKSRGSSQPQQTESRVYQSRLPEYAAPFYKNLVGRAQALSYEDYIPYEGPRVAGFSPETIGAQEGIKALAGRDLIGINQARDVAGRAATGGPMFVQSRFRGAPIRSTYTAAPIETGVRGFSPQAYLAASRGFGGRDAARLMNPYIGNVLDRQQRRAMDRFTEQQAARNLRATRAGAFGGSRQAVQDAIAERELNESLQDIEAKALSDAFTQAQQQFERDRTARFKGLTSADAQQLALAQQRSAEQIATEKAKQQAADQNLRAQIASGQFGQAAGKLDLEAQLANQRALEAAYGRGLRGAGVLAGLDRTEQALDMSRLKALSAVGDTRQALLQKAYDQQYEDFLAQREFPYQQLERFSAILQGMPTRPGFSERLFQPAANPTAQLLSTGLGAYGAFRGLGGGVG